MARYTDLIGKRFGKLTVSEKTDEREDRYYLWRCKCDCGNECLVNTKRLTRGTIRNCGCEPKAGNSHGNVAADLTGKTFFSLTALYRIENRNGQVWWHCRCSCGNEVDAPARTLVRGTRKSCGCKFNENRYYVDLQGCRIGYLTVLRKEETRDRKGNVCWLCRCDCGKELVYSSDYLRNGNIISCGCYRQEVLSKKMQNALHRVDGTCVELLLRSKARSDSKTGVIGVHKTARGTYRADINFKGKRYYLGTYHDLNDAIAARRKGEEIHRRFLENWMEQGE